MLQPKQNNFNTIIRNVANKLYSLFYGSEDRRPMTEACFFHHSDIIILVSVDTGKKAECTIFI